MKTLESVLQDFWYGPDIRMGLSAGEFTRALILWLDAEGYRIAPKDETPETAAEEQS